MLAYKIQADADYNYTVAATRLFGADGLVHGSDAPSAPATAGWNSTRTAAAFKPKPARPHATTATRVKESWIQLNAFPGTYAATVNVAGSACSVAVTVPMGWGPLSLEVAAGSWNCPGGVSAPLATPAGSTGVEMGCYPGTKVNERFRINSVYTYHRGYTHVLSILKYTAFVYYMCEL
jgi:hypothetical protein